MDCTRFAWVLGVGGLAAAGCGPAVELSTASDTEATTNGTNGTTSAGSSATNASTTSGTDVTTGGVTSEGVTTNATVGTFTTDSASGSTTGPESCFDGVFNGDETDLDCGGSCPPCDVGATCFEHEDCISGHCQDGLYCGTQWPAIWLDGKDTFSMLTGPDCQSPVGAADDPVDCWINKGVAGGTDGVFRPIAGTGVWNQSILGLEVNNTGYVSPGIFAGDLDDATIFLVQTEVASRDSFDFNLNHPDQTLRYSAHVPWGSNRFVAFDVGGTTPDRRVVTTANLFAVGELHMFEFVNASLEAYRAIAIDGNIHAEGDGNAAAAAADVSIGNNANTVIHEFRVYTPSPTPEHREYIEGELACRWSLRDRLPPDHPYFSPVPFDDINCPVSPPF